MDMLTTVRLQLMMLPGIPPLTAEKAGASTLRYNTYRIAVTILSS